MIKTKELLRLKEVLESKDAKLRVDYTTINLKIMLRYPCMTIMIDERRINLENLLEKLEISKDIIYGEDYSRIENVFEECDSAWLEGIDNNFMKTEKLTPLYTMYRICFDLNSVGLFTR